MEQEELMMMPPYLMDSSGAQPENGANRRTYGTLSYNKRRKCWVVKGDPGVTELCKRLFPGTDTSKRGEEGTNCKSVELHNNSFSKETFSIKSLLL